MSEDQIMEEIGFIEQVGAWPNWPVLPVKNMRRGDRDYPKDEEVGIILATQNKAIPQVILMNMWELETGSLTSQIEGKRRLIFDSIEAMVRDGWVGD